MNTKTVAFISIYQFSIGKDNLQSSIVDNECASH